MAMTSGANALVTLVERIAHEAGMFYVARVPKGARHRPVAAWSAGVVFVGLHCSLACVAVERQLDLSSVTARLRGTDHQNAMAR
ncbi:hypothetical protein Taro_042479 [Colocasia esculenta]|uniref:Uncharacterized protein n=1 Tax=Colocasia esculenta TaxID=4460 RepID=A0A843WZN1_COLES|nr:hypothetical protein [Colocasia esculenta]